MGPWAARGCDQPRPLAARTCRVAGRVPNCFRKHHSTVSPRLPSDGQGQSSHAPCVKRRAGGHGAPGACQGSARAGHTRLQAGVGPEVQAMCTWTPGQEVLVQQTEGCSLQGIQSEGYSAPPWPGATCGQEERPSWLQARPLPLPG